MGARSYRRLGYCSGCILVEMEEVVSAVLTMGIVFDLIRPQVTMGAGQVLFHRFYYRKSFREYDVRVSTANLC